MPTGSLGCCVNRLPACPLAPYGSLRKALKVTTHAAAAVDAPPAELAKAERKERSVPRPAATQGYRQQSPSQSLQADFRIAVLDDVQSSIKRNSKRLQLALLEGKTVAFSVAGINGVHGFLQAVCRTQQAMAEAAQGELMVQASVGPSVEPLGGVPVFLCTVRRAPAPRLATPPATRNAASPSPSGTEEPPFKIWVVGKGISPAAEEAEGSLSRMGVALTQASHRLHERMLQSGTAPGGRPDKVMTRVAVVSAMGLTNIYSMLQMMANAGPRYRRTLWFTPALEDNVPVGKEGNTAQVLFLHTWASVIPRAPPILRPASASAPPRGRSTAPPAVNGHAPAAAAPTPSPVPASPAEPASTGSNGAEVASPVPSPSPDSLNDVALQLKDVLQGQMEIARMLKEQTLALAQVQAAAATAPSSPPTSSPPPPATASA